MLHALRQLPSVDRLLGEERIRQLSERYSREAVLGLVRSRLEAIREAVSAGEACPSLEAIVASLVDGAQALWQPSLHPLINATGVILHTNLGRAPLSPEALAAMEEVARGYSNLEFALESGERGSRHSHLEGLLCQLTGAQAALAVNNNAAAVLLALSALVKGKEVVVSRGQAVEIGGGFRIPEVLRQSGARLVEVGTTNRTYIEDYAQALSPKTGTLLRVHTSNFRVVGFTHSARLEELVELGRRSGALVLDDLGSGCLLDTQAFGLAPEPKVQDSIAAGADLVFFSGDKLLGGPQAGIVVGKGELVERLRRHPLARAVRIDKLSLAALGATLLHYLRAEAPARVPVWQMIAAPLSDLEARAKSWAAALGEFARVVPGRSTVGGGSLPGETLPTALVAIHPPVSRKERSSAVAALGRTLRLQKPPIIGRIERETLLLDPRTVLPEQDPQLLGGVSAALRDWSHQL